MFGETFRLWGSEESSTPAAEVFAESEEKRSFDLEEYVRIRNATFPVSEFGAEEHTTAKDMWYRPSNKKTTGSAQNRAKVAQLARCVDTGGERLIFSLLESAANCCNHQRQQVLYSLQDRPSSESQGPVSKSLKGRWRGLHQALVAEKNKYKKIFLLMQPPLCRGGFESEYCPGADCTWQYLHHLSD